MNNNGEFILSTKDIIKKISFHFGLVFMGVFLILMVNQYLLIFNERPSLSETILLMIYSLPSVFVLSIPFSVCIGFIQGIIKLNKENINIGNHNIFRKLIVPVLCSGFILSVLDFIALDTILPNATVSFSNLYRTILANNKENIDPTGETPREMSSGKILQEIKKIKEGTSDDKKDKLNIYQLEFNKKLSLPLSVLVFSFFALSFSGIIRKYAIISFFVSIL